MNLRYYDVFVRVYERMNMSLVAEELFLSQPAVSRIIRELEDHYSIRFFWRQSGKLYRTAGGERFYQYAKELLACEEQLNFAIADQKLHRKLTLGVSPTIASYYLPAVLRSYHENCGELDIRLYSGQPSTLEQQLLDARMDIALVEGQVHSWEITSVPLFQDTLIPVTSADAPLPLSPPLPLLVRDAGDLERQQFEQTFRNAGVEYTIQGEFVDVEAIKRCAQQRLDIGLVPRGSILESDHLARVDIPGVEITARFSLVYHRKKFIFPQLVTFIDHIQSCLGKSADTSTQEARQFSADSE